MPKVHKTKKVSCNQYALWIKLDENNYVRYDNPFRITNTMR